MGYDQDDIQEKAWLRWFGRGADSLETKRRVAGSALHVDVALHGRLTFPPLDRFLPAGTVAVENKAPGTYLSLVDFFGFHGRLSLLIERNLEEGRTWTQGEPISGLVVTSRLARECERSVAFTPGEVYPGVRRLAGPLFDLYVWQIDRLDARPEHLAWVLLFASNARVRQVLDRVDLEALRPFLLHVYFLRRNLLRRVLKEKGIDMVTMKIDIKGTIEDLGIRRVVDEVGLRRVVDEVGLRRVVDEVGLERVVKEIGAERLIEQLGAGRVIEDLGAERVVEALGVERLQAILDNIRRKRDNGELPH